MPIELPDHNFLLEFENQLNPAYPEKSKIPAKILGYGEISSVFQIAGIDHLAFKRMPPFDSLEALQAYCDVLDEYCATLRSHGIRLVLYAYMQCLNKDGEQILYLAQPKLRPQSIGHQYLQNCSEKKLQSALTVVFHSLVKIWRANSQNAGERIIGLDAQISNWVIENGDTAPAYLDYSTPFLRKNGKDMLNIEIFLKSMPFFLAPVVRHFFLQQILDRYYDLRLVLIDLVANFHKEGLAEKIPAAVQHFNDLLKHEAPDLYIEPLRKDEIDKYYKNDAMLWKLLLNFRRFDRFLKTKLLRQKYNFILPGKIDR